MSDRGGLRGVVKEVMHDLFGRWGDSVEIGLINAHQRTLAEKLKAALAEPEEAPAKVERVVTFEGSKFRIVRADHVGWWGELDFGQDQEQYGGDVQLLVRPVNIDRPYPAERPVPVPRPKSREEELVAHLRAHHSDNYHDPECPDFKEVQDRLLREIGAKKGGGA